MLIGAIDYGFIEDFKKGGVPIIDAESGPFVIEEQLAHLLGGTASGLAAGEPSSVD
ncbi:hypothetical protein [Mycobacterium marinum]|uniref:hypothetical protein n=1 Tax=Mycobacterium marinum TaxID=1781 RepID=UPI0012939B66|nr:hypothetical protein [Mycobacterium marinum]